MDFLDPRKKRSRHIRLTIGYILISIAIGLGTIILVYGAYGYGINTKTGDIIENGLLFVDSKPGGAQIYLNGKNQKIATGARLVLPAGDYKLSLFRTGYRPWEREFSLQEHAIARYVYPFLFPEELQISSMKQYSSPPQVFTQSPDRRWLLVQTSAVDGSAAVFDEYDTGDLAKKPVQKTIPGGLLSGASPQLSVVEWSSDNNNVLLRNTFDNQAEYIIFNRSKPQESVNINKLFNTSPDRVVLRDRKADQLYFYSASERTLRLADVDKATVGGPVLKQVLAFTPYGNELITYVTDKDVPSGRAEARIWDNGRTYPLYQFSASDNYVVDAARFQGHWYYVAGGDKEERINIYKDPLDSLKDSSAGKANPMLALHQLGVKKLEFSNNARFIAAQDGQNFAVFDLETKENYKYTLKAPLAAAMDWMDGHRFIGQSQGGIFVMDYDSQNQQSLATTSRPDGGLFSRDFNHLLALRQAADGTGLELVDIDMRAGVDLPK